MNRSALPLVRSVQGLVRMPQPEDMASLGDVHRSIVGHPTAAFDPLAFPIHTTGPVFWCQIPETAARPTECRQSKSMEQPGDMAQRG